jgi:hypothetical protein
MRILLEGPDEDINTRYFDQSHRCCRIHDLPPRLYRGFQQLLSEDHYHCRLKRNSIFMPFRLYARLQGNVLLPSNRPSNVHNEKNSIYTHDQLLIRVLGRLSWTL